MEVGTRLELLVKGASCEFSEPATSGAAEEINSLLEREALLGICGDTTLPYRSRSLTGWVPPSGILSHSVYEALFKLSFNVYASAMKPAACSSVKAA